MDYGGIGSGDYGGGGPSDNGSDDSSGTPTSARLSCLDCFTSTAILVFMFYLLYLAFQFIASFFF